MIKHVVFCCIVAILCINVLHTSNAAGGPGQHTLPPIPKDQVPGKYDPPPIHADEGK
ncbi:unnamed protein product [Callosobruchus maculatus]|uniref:Uncharacterized protein n=1 Tax=Callosobruchus maculatus TaxID=64391 RepID=A0A653DC41_CALMS|nr:unnamed protein product [Callosobruchus maculatus]